MQLVVSCQPINIYLVSSMPPLLLVCTLRCTTAPHNTALHWLQLGLVFRVVLLKTVADASGNPLTRLCAASNKAVNRHSNAKRVVARHLSYRKYINIQFDRMSASTL